MLCVLLVGAPFSSTTLIGLLLLGCSGLWFMLRLFDPLNVEITPIHLLIAGYWGVVTIATAFSPVRSVAIEGWIKLTLYILLFVLLTRILRSPRFLNGILTVYLMTTLIVSAYGLRQWFLGAEALATWVDPSSPLAKTTRVYSYLGNPNLLASYLIPGVMFSIVAIFVWKQWGCKLLACFMAILNSACLILTFSRGGWIGFVVGLFILALLLIYWWSIQWSGFWQAWAIPLGLGLVTAVMIGAVLSIEPLQLRVQSLWAGRGDSSNNFRLNVWAAVLEMIRDRPLIGIGPGNDAFNQIYPLYQRPNFNALSAYSIPLEVAVEAGLVGLSCFLWLLFITFYQGWTQIHRLRKDSNYLGYWLLGAIATLAGLLGHGLVDTVWYRPQINMLWWLAMAIVASCYPPPVSSDNWVRDLLENKALEDGGTLRAPSHL